MRLALCPDGAEAFSIESLSRWAELPGLCCQAAGGCSDWADDLTVAWLLFYAAANIMDKVQDQDEPAEWWRTLGPGAALGAASGLYFSASLALNLLLYGEHTRPAAAEVIQDFYNSFLEMTSGQYGDLLNQNPSLEQYWSYVAAKSGSFFGLACRSAARLAIQDGERLHHFGRYGHHLGVLVQIRDDLDDIRPPSGGTVPGQRKELSRSLPIVYALAVLPEVEREQLQRRLVAAPDDETTAREVIHLLNEINVPLYLVAEMERHRQLALGAIRSATSLSPARESLEAYIQNI
jgi:geranylgeranyl diphosphate synthase type I